MHIFGKYYQRGFSVIEVILAAALFMIFSTGTLTLVLQGFSSNRLGEEEAIANQYASEGIEAVRSIRNQSYSSLINSAGTGVIKNGSGVWAFSGSNNTFGKYTRVITITDVQRDGSGNVVSSGGTVDANTKKATVTVSWNFSPTRNNSIVLSSYLTNWKAQIPVVPSGVLVYGDGGTTTDAIKYKTFDGTTWSAAGSAADVDGATANKAVRIARMYSSISTPPTFDAKTSAVFNSFTSGSFAHTVSASANRLLIVTLSYRAHNNPTAQANTITYGGVALTNLSRTVAADRVTEMWYLVAPASGSNNVTTTMSADPEDIVITAVSYTGVDQTAPLGTISTNSGTGTAESVSLISSSNQTVLSVVTNYPNGGGNTITGDGLLRSTANTAANNISSTVTENPGGGTVTVNWTAAQSFSWSASAVPINSSSTNRNEKVLITRHYNGSVQFIYAQVFNGTTWGNVQLLSSWTAATFLDVQNFDAAYMANGTLMVVFSDNTVIPKMRTWNGTSWSAQTSLTTLGANQIPASINISARPGSNEVMAAFFTQGASATAGNTITQYYSGSAWSAITSHATATPTNTKQLIDFAWSPNSPLIGALLFSNSTTDQGMDVRLWQSNGAGSGSWGTTASAANQGAALGAESIVGRNGSNEFMACNKDAAATPTIRCLKVTFTGTTATWVTPTNSQVSTATDTGLQRSFELSYESGTGSNGMIVYSDNTAVPKFKKYTPGTSTWDAAATSIATTGFSPGVFKSVKILQVDGSDDLIVLLADANLDVYSVLWDGTNNQMYTTPAGKAWTQHGTNGSAVTEFWFGFGVDKL
jgi:autotransporter-associated beta strand protein